MTNRYYPTKDAAMKNAHKLRLAGRIAVVGKTEKGWKVYSYMR